MRVLVLRAPPAHAAESLPPCFATPIDEGALREWLAHPSARRAFSPVRAGARIEEVLSTLDGAHGDHGDAIAVLYVPARTLVGPEDAAALDLDAAFAHTSAAADESVETLIADAESFFEKDDWITAERLFRLADDKLGEETSVRRAEVLVGLGEISRLQGRAAEAARILDHALSMSPGNQIAQRGRTTLARTLGEHALAASLLHRLASIESDPHEKGELLSTVAAESLEAAREAIAAALVLNPADRGLLERLRAAYEAAGKWDDAVTVSVQLAEGISDRKERARALAAAAALSASRTRNAARAVALYEAAITDDPQVPGAFEAIETALIAAGDSTGLAAAYERQIERLPGEEASAERVALLGRFAVVLRDWLKDKHGAIRALDRLAAAAPDNLQVRIDLADLLDEVGERTLATRCLEVAAQQDPLAPSVYRRLLRSFKKLGDPDRAFAASAAMVALGEADGDEQALYAEHAPLSPLPFKRPFDDDIWTELATDEHATDIESVFAEIEDVCIEAWIATRELGGGLSKPQEELRVDPATTTVTAVRTFAWASRLIGVPEPALYAAPDNARVSAATLPARTKSVLLGRPVLTGRSPVELVFIAARHLSYFRPGRHVLAYYPTRPELEQLLLAAVTVLRPDLVPRTSLRSSALDVGARLERTLDPARRARLGVALGKIWTGGGVVNLQGWLRSVEATACRAALLATGDIAVARLLLAVSGGPAGGLSAADRVRDLLGFSVTQRYAALRRLLGVSVG